MTEERSAAEERGQATRAGEPPPFIAARTAALAGRYVIERELGRGGMATVYLARDLRHRRPVAIKVLSPDLSLSLGAERFLREIELAANLQHPHVVPLFDSGEAAGRLYYVMPYVEGESLRDRLTREGQLAVQDAIQLTREVAGALDYAHEQGVVHRDVKPENVLLSRGHALVADFGIARAVSRATEGASREALTQTGLAAGEGSTLGEHLTSPVFLPAVAPIPSIRCDVSRVRSPNERLGGKACRQTLHPGTQALKNEPDGLGNDSPAPERNNDRDSPCTDRSRASWQ